MKTNVKLTFYRELTERDLIEAKWKGYLSHVLVEVEDGTLYPVIFYDSTRLKQDVEEGAKQGQPFVADPGMIVLLEVTLPAMRAAVEKLFEWGYFRHIVPTTLEAVKNVPIGQWPP